MAVGAGKLQSAPHIDCGGHHIRRGIDHGDLAAAVVEHEQPARRRVVDQGIGVLAGALDLARGLERLGIENRDHPRLPVGDESLADPGHDADAVYAGQACDRADHRARGRVEHRDLGTVRDVQPLGRIVQVEVVVTAVPRYRNLLQHAI